MALEALRILLIEHDPAFARYVGEMLGQTRGMKAELQGVSDFFGGLRCLCRAQFDAVLIYLCVPDGAGLGNVALRQACRPG